MDTQLKKGLLEICVLAVLKKEDSYGYKIVKDISPYIEICESTLYPILRTSEKILQNHRFWHCAHSGFSNGMAVYAAYLRIYQRRG